MWEGRFTPRDQWEKSPAARTPSQVCRRSLRMEPTLHENRTLLLHRLIFSHQLEQQRLCLPYRTKEKTWLKICTAHNKSPILPPCRAGSMLCSERRAVFSWDTPPLQAAMQITHHREEKTRHLSLCCCGFFFSLDIMSVVSNGQLCTPDFSLQLFLKLCHDHKELLPCSPYT